MIGRQGVRGEKRIVARVLSLLLCLAGVLSLSTLNAQWKPEWDSAYLLTITQSLLAGDGYTYLGHPALKQPPGLPVLLAPIIWVAGMNLLVLNALMIGFALFALWGIFVLLRSASSERFALYIAVLVGVSYVFLYNVSYIMTDIPYLAVSVVAVLGLRKLFADHRTGIHGLVPGLLMGISYLLRAIGFVLILAFFARIVFDRVVTGRFSIPVRKMVLVACVALAPMVVWNIHLLSVKTDGSDPASGMKEFISYGGELQRAEQSDRGSLLETARGLAGRIAKNAAYYAGETSSVIWGVRIDTSVDSLRTHSKWLLILMFLTACVPLGGFLIAFRRMDPLMVFYVLLYLLVLLVWPFRETRFLVPMLPFLFCFVVFALSAAAGKLRVQIAGYQAGELVLAVFLCFFLVTNSVADSSIVARQRSSTYYRGEEANMMEAISWIRANTREDARIVSVQAPWVTFLSGRPAFSFPFVDDSRVVSGYLDALKPDYVVAGPLLGNRQRFLVPTIRENPRRFQEVFRANSMVVYGYR